MFGRREAEKDFLIHKYLFVMLIAAVGVYLITITKSSGIPYAMFLAAPASTSGIVTAFTIEGDADDGRENIQKTRTLSYTFDDLDGITRTKMVLIEPSLPFTAQVGQPIEITYFRCIPGYSQATEMLRYLAPGFWIMMVGVCLILIGVVVSLISVFQLVKHYREDRYY